MAVTKRTRFEVLRRDAHTCQYCGAKAPDVALTIDHVMPVSLGGDDKPGNLVTACRECNSGKASITPDSPLVQGLSDRAAAYALGVQDRMTRFRQDLEDLDAYVVAFHEEWDKWEFTNGVAAGDRVPLPDDYTSTLLRWVQIGVPTRAMKMAIAKAMVKPGIRGEYGVFQYTAGVVKGMLDQRDIDLTVTAETAAVYTSAEHRREVIASYWRGFKSGKLWARTKATSLDLVRNLIDGTRPVEDEMSGEWRVERIGAG